MAFVKIERRGGEIGWAEVLYLNCPQRQCFSLEDTSLVEGIKGAFNGQFIGWCKGFLTGTCPKEAVNGDKVQNNMCGQYVKDGEVWWLKG